ncbi:unnamed protein product [Cylicocyclus nassatus]|uniref:SCP domain-containing protein n=1 Tax=Cylicocyclus nassatus TaxID=53992 RepID=A0AA36GP37_CYLNA|nr:unnamed protein product [Cylicocyclus nassatus]
MREQIAKNQVSGGPSFKKAKNMYKLFWNCTTLTKDYAQNYAILTLNTAAGSAAYYTLKATTNWFQPVVNYGLDKNQPYTSGLDDFANMVNAKATQIACAYIEDTAASETHYSCIFNVKPIKGQSIYENGTPCKKSADCTTYPDSSCEKAKGLCVYTEDIPEPELTSTSETTTTDVTSTSETTTTDVTSTSETTTTDVTSTSETTTTDVTSTSETTTTGVTSTSETTTTGVTSTSETTTTDVTSTSETTTTDVTSTSETTTTGVTSTSETTTTGVTSTSETTTTGVTPTSETTTTDVTSTSETTTTGVTPTSETTTTDVTSTSETTTTDVTSTSETTTTDVTSTRETTTTGVTSTSETTTTGVAPTSATTTADINSDNDYMTAAGRNKAVKTHNYRRTLLATGQIRNGKNPSNANLPTAAFMSKMEYDMDLEAQAIDYAKGCSLKKSDESTRPGIGENVYVHDTVITDQVELFNTVAISWWTQIFKDGINRQLIFSENLRDKQAKKGIDQTAFTQMAWANTNKIGCAVVDCSGKSFVVCRYSPAGNILNQTIYRIGNVCGLCGGTCSPDVGLCTMT